jgi:polyvinyl alcohol dehydrogenase (cytochrome)
MHRDVKARDAWCPLLLAAILLAGPGARAVEPVAQPDAAFAAGDRKDFDGMRGGVTGGERHPGAALYRDHCARCHSRPVPRAPDKSFLEMIPGDAILHTLNDGVMQPMAAKLTPEERRQVAEYLAGTVEPRRVPAPSACVAGASPFDYDRPPPFAGWGVDPANTRFIPADVARLAAADVPKLQLKWAFAFPGLNRARSQPGFGGGALYVGSADGHVYALDADTGCMRWRYRAGAEVRTGVTVSPWPRGERPARVLGYFSDIIARVYAVDLVTGEPVWVTKVDPHPAATTTAQPVLVDGVVYQGVSSLEEAAAADPAYRCCTFRGSVVALDAATGAVKWRRYTIDEEPRPSGVRRNGNEMWAPSGAPVWNSATYAPERRRLYVATGGNYSSPAQHTSDAILALDAADGRLLWVRQVTARDAWNVACFPFLSNHANCPDENGPDVDFGSPPIFVRGGAGDVLVAGQKSGDVWGIDPDSGALRWHTKVGRGGNQGGMNFGMAAAAGTVFVPISDMDDRILSPRDARPGLYALDAFTGALRWEASAGDVCAPRGEDCDPGISQAITAIPGAVFAGHLDGRFRAYDSATGRVLWEFDTWREFETLSGEPARGGSFSGASGPMIVDGTVYASSGYGIYFHMPGNVLLAFAIP